jgi:lipopolysaccharide export system protein LptA
MVNKTCRISLRGILIAVAAALLVALPVSHCVAAPKPAAKKTQTSQKPKAKPTPKKAKAKPTAVPKQTAKPTPKQEEKKEQEPPKATLSAKPVEEKSAKNEITAGTVDFEKAPTYIESDTLTLKSNDRKFYYTGNVKVTQGDMELTSQTLEGSYDENNKIQTLTARKSVVIKKGPSITARGELAVYEAAKNMMTITENPSVEQEGNLLTADVVHIYLKENRSTAEGNVKVKLMNKGGSGGLGGLTGKGK